MWPYLAQVATVDERKDAIRAAVKHYHEAGYTGLIDMAMDEGAVSDYLRVRRGRYPCDLLTSCRSGMPFSPFASRRRSLCASPPTGL